MAFTGLDVQTVGGLTWSIEFGTFVNEPLSSRFIVLGLFNQLSHFGHHTVFGKGSSLYSNIA